MNYFVITDDHLVETDKQFYDYMKIKCNEYNDLITELNQIKYSAQLKNVYILFILIILHIYLIIHH